MSFVKDLIVNGLENLGFIIVRDLIDEGFPITSPTFDSTLVTMDDTTHTMDEA